MKSTKQKAIEKAIDLTDKVYDDGAKSFVKETGKTISLIPQTINAVFSPLQKWILNRDYSVKETKKLLEEKLKNIDSKDIVEPPTYIAIPTIQAISYSMDNETLRDMYANLLAKSMIVHTRDKVHPALVDIIKQMSPNDAKIYELICSRPVRPVLDLSYSANPSPGFDGHLYNISWIDSYDYQTVSVCISNLMRMGLIEIDSGSSYTNDSNYDIVRQNSAYIDYKNRYNKVPNIKFHEDKHFIKITPIGELFYSICLK